MALSPDEIDAEFILREIKKEHCVLRALLVCKIPVSNGTVTVSRDVDFTADELLDVLARRKDQK
jgi:hypothetical protein